MELRNQSFLSSATLGPAQVSCWIKIHMLWFLAWHSLVWQYRLVYEESTVRRSDAVRNCLMCLFVIQAICAIDIWTSQEHCLNSLRKFNFFVNMPLNWFQYLGYKWVLSKILGFAVKLIPLWMHAIHTMLYHIIILLDSSVFLGSFVKGIHIKLWRSKWTRLC